MHAVLAEDVDTLKMLLDADRQRGGKPRCNVNTRYRDARSGRTPASSAVEQGSLLLLQILVNTGRADLNIRVKVNEDVSSLNVYYSICMKRLRSKRPSHMNTAF